MTAILFRMKILILAILFGSWIFAMEAALASSADGFGSRDFSVPREVWSKIVEFSKDHLVYFAPVRVSFSERNAGVLLQPELERELPIGGGDIDLALLEGRNPGSFFVRFKLPPGALDYRAYFLSFGEAARVEGLEAGVGCARAFDLTRGLKSWNGLGEKKGLILNTSYGLFVYALAGHWIFVSKLPGARVEISKVTFFHSRNRQAQCPGLI